MSRILVVDDDPQLLPLMVEVLDKAGYDVDGALSLAEAKAAVGPFDALVIDLLLPNGDGRHVADRWSGVPAVFISGNLYRDADLHKPFTMRQLVTAVSERVGRTP